MLIEHACAKVVLESVAANDRQDYEAFAAFFASDGLLFRPGGGEALCGRQEIVESYQARPPNRMTRHVCTNIVVHVESRRSAAATTYVILYTADSLKSESKVGVKCDSRALIGELEDRFTLTAEGWRISERHARFVMHT